MLTNKPLLLFHSFGALIFSSREYSFDSFGIKNSPPLSKICAGTAGRFMWGALREPVTREGLLNFVRRAPNKDWISCDEQSKLHGRYATQVVHYSDKQSKLQLTYVCPKRLTKLTETSFEIQIFFEIQISL